MVEDVAKKCHKLFKLFYTWPYPNHLARDFVTWSSDVSKAAGSDIIKRLMQHNPLWHVARMITAFCASFRSLILYPGWTGKLLRHFSEKTEASHLFLTNIDLYKASFDNCVELRKATATNRREKGSSFNFARYPYGYRLCLHFERKSEFKRWLESSLRSWVSLLTYMYLSTA